jgi:hypothetical protein
MNLYVQDISCSFPTDVKTIIIEQPQSLNLLAKVMTLTISCLMVLVLFFLQMYMDELRKKCVRRQESGKVSRLKWVE